MKLSIVLPVNGRPEFTLRFLRHADARKLPYRFIVADGKVRPYLDGILSDAQQHFPNLTLEYRRYPDDRSFSAYFAKMRNALDHVTTPYVMMVDNDDFLGPDGIERAVDFLDSHPDFVCASGRVLGFSVHGSADGSCGSLNRRYLYHHAEELAQKSAAERIRCGGLRLWVYYAIYRTDILRRIHAEICDVEPPDLLLYEAFRVMRALIFGKAHLDPDSVSYFRQYGTSSSPRPRRWSPYGAAYMRMATIFTAFGRDVFAAMRSAIEEKAARLRTANSSLTQRVHDALTARYPRLAAWWRKRYRIFAFLEWQRTKRLIGTRATQQAKIEFKHIAQTLSSRPDRRRQARSPQPAYRHSQEIAS